MTIAVFLLTDIEGSTRHWNADPAGMRRSLERHDAAVRATVEAHGGTVFKHTGDGIVAVCPTARSAVIAAAAVQRRLGSLDWGGAPPLRVRAAVDAGEAEPSGDDWFGPALNRAARLLDLAHGGQVLVSDSAASMARDGLPADLVLIDLGRHDLRDVPHAERVWQLHAEGMEHGFGPLRSPAAHRSNLPLQLTSFVGRDRDVTALVARLAVDRLLTLVGPGGVGKTRLAIEAAAAAAVAFPDGAWIVELGPLRDGEAVDHAVAAVLEVTPRAGSSARELVAESIASWHGLLLLDNCEHLVQHVGALVADVLAAGPAVRILATSREPLGVAGEHVWAVMPLSADTAGAELFMDRAAANDRSLLRVEEDVAAVRTICRRLDGMPLAIELAAARNSALTPSEIVDRLDQRFSLLRRRSATAADDRHASLQAVLDWSFDLLADDLQELFRRLAVFPGDFDLGAATAVCAEGGDEFATLDRLEALVEKSLVVAEERRAGGRFSLLETMRQYAAERVDANEARDLRARHARHFVALAEASWAGCRGVDEVEWLNRVTDEKHNLRAATAWAIEQGDVDAALRVVAHLMPYSRSRGDGEVWDWVRAALDLPGALDHRLIPRALAHAAFAANRGSDPAAGERLGRLGLARQEALGLPPEPALFVALGGAVTFGGRPTEGLALHRLALAAAEQRGDDFAHDAADAAYQMCFTTLAAGDDMDPAFVARTVALAEQAGSVGTRANAKWVQGASLFDTDPRRAVEILREAEELARRADYRFLVGLAPLWAALIMATFDLRAGLARWAEALGYLATSRNRLGLRATLRSAMPALMAARRADLVALVDGAGLEYTIRKRQTASAVAAAQAELGLERYGELREQGRSLDDDALIALLRREVAAVLAPGSSVRGSASR